jgi:signal transduction histidine kinase/DNA-binding response OmpR family regulator
MKRRTLDPRLGLAAIVLAAVALIGLTWFGTLYAVQSQRAEATARVAGRVASQAIVFDERLHRRMLEVDQVLRILAQEWQEQPAKFDLKTWQSQLVLLKDISPDLFIADETGIVRHHTIPEAVGTQVADTDYFRHEAARADNDDGTFIGATMIGPFVKQWHMNIARRLRHPDGSFAGVIVAALQTEALSNFYRIANLGARGMLLIVDLTNGQVRVGKAQSPIEPGTSLADTAMFQAMRAAPDGVWTGPSPLDGVERVHGFCAQPDQNLGVVVAVDRAEVMRANRRWVQAAYIFAAGITALLLLMAGILAYILYAARRREAELQREQAMLATANSQLEAAKGRADAKTAQLEATFAGMSDPVVMIDANLQLLEWNPPFAKLAAMPEGALRVGLPMSDILRHKARCGLYGAVDVEAEVRRRLATLPTDIETTMIELTQSDGTVVAVRHNRLPDGGYVTVYTDITARKRTEDALRQASALSEAAARAMSRFVAIVSHEIRTPVNALLNSLDLLADSTVEPSQQTLLAVARQSGSALGALINDILELSRMEAGQLTLRPTRFALRPLLQSALDMFKAQAAERRIVLRLSVASDVPHEVYSDPGRLRQIMINLLSNAVKFAVPGEVRITADICLDGGLLQLRLAVRDRGPVIPAADRSELFQPFARLDQTDSEGRLGTGLGLVICRQLVALMSGEIGCDVWYVGNQPAGNQFWISLPLDTAVSSAGANAGQARQQPILPRTRILLVEDTFANQMVTALLLRRAGHLVDVANDGAAALRALQRHPYDLIFMDIFMPGMNGTVATRHIRAMTGPAAATPVIALTANVGAEDRAFCTAAGMNGLLAKPVALIELLEAIAEHVWPFRSHVLPIVMPALAASSAILSTSRIADLRSSVATETLRGLTEECLTELNERLPKLLQSIHQQQPEATFAEAHAMAGMAASYGMLALENRLRLVMHCIRQTPESVQAVADELATDVADAAVALRAALQTTDA